MMFKKATFAIFLSFIAVLVMALPAAAQSGPDLLLANSASEVAVGSTFTVTVSVVTNGQPFDAAELHLNFDPALLQVVSATVPPSSPLNIPLIAPAFNNTAGTVDFAYGKLGGPYPSQTSDVLVITFSVEAEGEAVFTPVFDVPNFRNTLITFAGQNILGDVETEPVSLVQNDPPVAVNDTFSVDEDEELTGNVLTNDSDPDDDDLTAIKVTDPANGELQFNSNGSFTYTPDANFSGTDSFTYKANDDALDSNTATVNITVDPVNDAPVAVNDTASTTEDNAVSVDVTANDTDIDSSNSSLTPVNVSNPANGSTSVVNGDVVYTPDPGFTGQDSFTYQVSDGSATSANTATVTITVGVVNEAPTATDDNAVTNEDDDVVISVLSNDDDADDDDLEPVNVSDPANGTAVVNQDGTITYTPDANFNGTDSFTYQASDGIENSTVAVVSITINPVNDAPVAVNDTASTSEGNAINIDVVANDTDIDSPNSSLIPVNVSDPANGSTSVVNGEVVYTPDANFTGQDSFTYKVSDGSDTSNNTATVTITVAQVNDVFMVITPAISNVFVGQTFDVVVQVQPNGQQVDLGEVHLNFDPNLLQVTNLTAGTTLTAVLEGPDFDNDDGEVDYAAGTFSNFPTSAFDLLTITFEAIAEGAATLSYENIFPRDTIVTFNGADVLVGANGATVNISSAAQLVGSFTMQGRTNYAVQLAVNLYVPGEAIPAYTFTPTATSNGEFTISGIEPGTYEVAVKYSNTLQNVVTVTLASGGNTEDFGELRAGDANNDNIVSAQDFSLLVTTFNLAQGDNGYLASADFNGNGFITAQDFSLLVSNFNVAGQKPSGS